MAKKPVINIHKDEEKPFVPTSKEELIDNFKKLMASYQIQNPTKFAIKKEALEDKLKKLEANL